MKISRKSSIILSMIISIVFFLAIVAAAVFMQAFVKMLREYLTLDGFKAIIILGYAVVLTAAAADGLLFWLLVRVYREQVFTPKSIALIRAVSWCCMLVAVLFAIMGYYFFFALIVSAAAVLLSLCLRVVKNVIETATEIKNENDLTV